MPKIKTAFSPSFLKEYIEGCPFCAVNNPYGDNIFGKFGTFSHDMLDENVLKSPASIIDPSMKAHQDLVEPEQLSRYMHFINSENADYRKFMDKARNIIRNYNLKKGYIGEGFGIWDTESRKAPAQHSEVLYGSRNLSVKIFPGGRRMRGKTDRIDLNPARREWVISDYKTGKSSYSKFQLICYTIMFRFAFKIVQDTVKCRYIFIEEGTDWDFIPDEKEIMDTYNACLRAVNTYDTGIHVKKPSNNNCRWCKIEDCDKRRGR